MEHNKGNYYINFHFVLQKIKQLYLFFALLNASVANLAGILYLTSIWKRNLQACGVGKVTEVEKHSRRRY